LTLVIAAPEANRSRRDRCGAHSVPLAASGSSAPRFTTIQEAVEEPVGTSTGGTSVFHSESSFERQINYSLYYWGARNHLNRLAPVLAQGAGAAGRLPGDTHKIPLLERSCSNKWPVARIGSRASERPRAPRASYRRGTWVAATSNVVTARMRLRESRNPLLDELVLLFL